MVPDPLAPAPSDAPRADAPRAGRRAVNAILGALLGSLGLASSGQAAEFTCAAADAVCLVAAIRLANGLGEPSTIRLSDSTYTLKTIDNQANGANGLPSVTGTVTIQGSGAGSTVIERAFDAPEFFRLVHIAPTGNLTLEGLTLRGGIAGFSANDPGGGGIFNAGRVTLSHCRLAGNRLIGGIVHGGGLLNLGGTTVVSSSTVAENFIPGIGNGGGLAIHGGSMTITNSAIVDNLIIGIGGSGGGIAEASSDPSLFPIVDIVNSTIARNRVTVRGGGGGGLTAKRGRWRIINSTIAGNFGASVDDRTGGISGGPAVSLQNTIVAQNDVRDCFGSITSLDHNLIGDPTGCAIALGPHDRTGRPGLGIYTDDGTPGHGHWPLLATSPAVAGGGAAACPPTDQLGRSRGGVCGIGAVAFTPAPDPFADFVTGFYRYALGRSPSPTEVAGWVSVLQSDPTAASARVMTHAFFDGPEYRARPVTRESHVTALYRAILGRDPELVGLTGWVELLRDRLSTVAGMFLASPEFQALVPDCHDATAVRAYVVRLYETILGQSPGMATLENWVLGVVPNCALIGPLAFLLDSKDYLSVPRTLPEQVVVLYRALLAREPSSEEVAPWIDVLFPLFVEDQFIDSPEFAARWQQLVSTDS